MVIFRSYVSLPEGITWENYSFISLQWLQYLSMVHLIYIIYIQLLLFESSDLCQIEPLKIKYIIHSRPLFNVPFIWWLVEMSFLRSVQNS